MQFHYERSDFSDILKLQLFYFQLLFLIDLRAPRMDVDDVKAFTDHIQERMFKVLVPEMIHTEEFLQIFKQAKLTIPICPKSDSVQEASFYKSK